MFRFWVKHNKLLNNNKIINLKTFPLTNILVNQNQNTFKLVLAISFRKLQIKLFGYNIHLSLTNGINIEYKYNY
ncbi:unnamed protein product [Paramecium pentaurelia]|uniref:Uncharacterized protein n=1 Tax=Paramecium pentaurelia TaxID=43138 RepID=A0A8S1UTE7_9CILI|nr:unnamed protein product [Paramecium pentaurelia]